MPLNRLVAFATPIFSALAAVGSGWLAKHGINASSGQITAVEITVATSALGSALSWLHGHQKYEALIHSAEQAAIHAATYIENEVAPQALNLLPLDPEAKARAQEEIVSRAKAEGEKIVAAAQQKAQELVKDAADAIVKAVPPQESPATQTTPVPPAVA